MIERKYATGVRSLEGDSLTSKLVPKTLQAPGRIALALAFRTYLAYGTYDSAPDLSEGLPCGETALARPGRPPRGKQSAVLFAFAIASAFTLTASASRSRKGPAIASSSPRLRRHPWESVFLLAVRTRIL